MNSEIWIPITGFLSTAVVLGLFFHLRFRAKLEYQKTVRVAIERGQQLSPELLARLGERPAARGRNRDLRIGVISIALGVALARDYFAVVEAAAPTLPPAPALSAAA